MRVGTNHAVKMPDGIRLSIFLDKVCVGCTPMVGVHRKITVEARVFVNSFGEPDPYLCVLEPHKMPNPGDLACYPKIKIEMEG